MSHPHDITKAVVADMAGLMIGAAEFDIDSGVLRLHLASVDTTEEQEIEIRDYYGEHGIRAERL